MGFFDDPAYYWHCSGRDSKISSNNQNNLDIVTTFRQLPVFVLSCVLIMFGLQLRAEEQKTSNDKSLPEHPLIVCLGDSLTKYGYPQELEKLLHVRVINAGVGGNTSRQGLKRLEKDVTSHKPDLVIFFFGTNDSRRDAPKTQVGLEEYRTNLVTIIDRCQKSGSRVLLGVMPPITKEAYFTRHPKESYDSVGGFETYIGKYRDTAKAIGKEKNIPVVDLNTLLQKYPNWVSQDGVHPTEEGNKIMATLIAEKVRPILNLPAEKK